MYSKFQNIIEHSVRPEVSQDVPEGYLLKAAYASALIGAITEMSTKCDVFVQTAELASFIEELNDIISVNEALISSSNQIIAALPTIKPVAPPSGFEAFLRNTSQFIDATLGTVVDIVANGLATIVEGVGSGIGKMFGSSPLFFIVIGIVALTVVPKIVAASRSEATVHSNGNAQVTYQDNRKE